MQGCIFKGILNYVDGVNQAHKAAVDRHAKEGGLHALTQAKFGVAGASATMTGIVNFHVIFGTKK